MSDRDEIGEIIGQTYYSSHFEPAQHAADAILASDWLARRDAEVAAKALEDAADVFAEGAWNDAFMAGEVEDDVSAVQATEAWFKARATALRASSLGAENPEPTNSEADHG